MDGSTVVASYEQFAERAASIAAALRESHGIGPGDRVAVFMPNRTDYLECSMASGRIRAVLYSLNITGCYL
jgi:acyl-CoA synthetase (AMP-forming)/AMP-acid ligase II